MGDLQSVSQDDGIPMLLRSIDADRLVLFCGAGLSMGSPTELPSAAKLADDLATAYETAQGIDLSADLHWDLEAFARHVYGCGELNAHVIQKMSWDRYRGNPNPAHEAVADLLLANASRAVVSANYDTHIEDAATSLGERDFLAALDGDEIDRLPDRYRPLLKIHGCCARDRDNTVWLVEQLRTDPIHARSERSRVWADAELRQRDLLFVGFWTDWAYLNEIFEKIVANVATPDTRRVVVVDPKTSSELEEKAAELWQWASRTENVDFIHVRARAEEFLHELRVQMGHLFLRKLLRSGFDSYQILAAEPPPAGLYVPEFQSSAGLYNLRRDLTGAAPSECVATIEPTGLETLGAILLRLLHHGAEVEGPAIRVNDQSIRVVHGAGQLISQIRARMERGSPTSLAVDRIICVGAIPDAGINNVVRDGRPSSITRPSVGGNWETAEQLIDEIFPGADE